MSDKKLELQLVEVNGQAQVILPEARVTTRNPVAMPASDTRPRETPGMIPDEETTGFNWAPWGHNDCLPTDIRAMIEQIPMAGQAIYRLTQMMVGNGLAYYHNDELADGPKVRRHYQPKIEGWLQRNRIGTRWLVAQAADYRYYMNAFSELIFNNRRDQVTNIYHKPAEFCRLSCQNPNNYEIEYLYYSPWFAEGRYPGLDKIRKIRLYQWQQSDFVNDERLEKMAWHTRFETPGIMYYARPFWLGLFRKNGWADASRQVPEVVNAMMRNQIVLKYHILIPESYFEVRYPTWQSYTHEQREVLINALIDDINDTLSGTTNAYASIATVFKLDHLSQQALGKIEIIAVDDKIKKDAWVPSSDRADAQIVQGLGLHPSQVGLAPEGGKMGAGSGSDQREAFNTGITVNTLDQTILLEPLNWIARFNAQADPDWNVTFFIDHTHHTTTNNVESGMVPSDNTIEITE